MIDFLMRAVGALVFLMLYLWLSSSAKRMNTNRYEGKTVRLPRAFHSLLFPGAKWERRPLISVMLSATCLVSAFAVFVSSVWITFFLDVGETEKAFIYSYSFASILCCFLIVTLILWIIIIMHQKSVHIAIRAVIVVLTVMSLLHLVRPFIDFVLWLLCNG